MECNCRCYDTYPSVVVEEKQMAENQQQEIEVLQRKVSELQGELKTELKHSKSTDAETHVSSITRCLWYLM
jgi:hypothetical protein